MFLERLLQTNRPLAEAALAWQQDGTILPDTYVIDLDALVENASTMLSVAENHGVRLYFMLKQLGRNPLVASTLAGMGFAGVVCVDFREALVMEGEGIPLGNVGHLVQTPAAVLRRILGARPDIMTVYSLEKAKIPTPSPEDEAETKATGRVAPGSVSFVPSVAGLYLAYEAARIIWEGNKINDENPRD